MLDALSMRAGIVSTQARAPPAPQMLESTAGTAEVLFDPLEQNGDRGVMLTL
jgi:hypothetical protein